MRTSRPVPSREGFALLAVLWIVTGLTVLGLAASLAARDAVRAAHNRSGYLRALWRAEGCVELARANLQRRIVERGNSDGRSGPLSPREVFAIGGVRRYPQCEGHVRPLGARLDLDRVDRPGLGRFLAEIGIAGPRADSLLDALGDWQDEDHRPRPLGAEVDWYLGRGRPGPRNGSLRAPAELRLVRGWDLVPHLDSLVGVDEGPVPVSHAPAPVLAALPGITPEAARFIAWQRRNGLSLTDLRTLPEALPHPSGDSLARHFAEFSRAALSEPRGWIVSATARDGRLAVTVEARLGHSGSRLAVLSRRRWIR